MLKNEEFIEEFKKSLSATIKSIGKNDNLEINYVKENPSVVGNQINLTEPNIENIRNNLDYLRAEADSLALEFRLHSKEIHNNFINKNEFSNQIINALEQTRIEVEGSKEFKGVGKNILTKHVKDLNKKNKKNSQDLLIQAFRYVSFEELSNKKLGKEIKKFRALLENKLKNNFNNFFQDLRENVHDQEKFTKTIIKKLVELGLINEKQNNIEDENIYED